MDRLNFCDEKLYYIGGVVRDELLKKDSFDIDITYVGDAIEYCKNLEKNRLCKILKINEPFGTVRVLINNNETDIASTRNEIYVRKGHLPIVTEIGCELKKDVLRRDFTVNTLAKSVKTGEIIDYTGGLKDIKEKKLRILHDESFIDDPTRIIRGLKFSVRFGFVLDKHTKKLQDEYLDNINYDMSYKRLKKELMETFNLNLQKAFQIFIEQKMYKLLTTGIVEAPNFDIQSLVNNYPVKNTWLVYLAWMDLSKLPLSKEELKIVEEFKQLKNEELPQDDFEIYKLFKDKSLESVLLYIININEKVGMRYLNLRDITLNITGQDLKEMGIAPSPEYAKCFDYVLKHKLNNPLISKEMELRLAKEFFSS